MADPSMMPPLPTGRFALFLDVDGTLVDLAPRPDAVVVPPELARALVVLAARLEGALALVSGRPIADLDRLFAPSKFRASGVHGAEMRTAADGPVVTRAEDGLPDALVGELAGLAAAHEGTLVENKGFSVAIHYRANPGAGPALRDALGPLLGGHPELKVLPGHMVFEVKPGSFDKGQAISNFLRQAPFAGRRPLFIGDDVTDLPGFAAVLAAGGLAYSVTTSRPGLSGHFDTPGEVRSWLGALTDREGN